MTWLTRLTWWWHRDDGDPAPESLARLIARGDAVIADRTSPERVTDELGDTQMPAEWRCDDCGPYRSTGPDCPVCGGRITVRRARWSTG